MRSRLHVSIQPLPRRQTPTVLYHSRALVHHFALRKQHTSYENHLSTPGAVKHPTSLVCEVMTACYSIRARTLVTTAHSCGSPTVHLSENEPPALSIRAGQTAPHKALKLSAARHCTNPPPPVNLPKTTRINPRPLHKSHRPCSSPPDPHAGGVTLTTAPHTDAAPREPRF